MSYRYREDLTHLPIETVRDILPPANAEWHIWERGMSDAEIQGLRDMNVRGPLDTSEAMQELRERPYRVHPDIEPNPSDEDSPEEETAAARLWLIASKRLLDMTVEDTPAKSVRKFLALVYHLSPETQRAWGGMRGVAAFLGVSAPAFQRDVRRLERLIGPAHNAKSPEHRKNLSLARK